MRRFVVGFFTVVGILVVLLVVVGLVAWRTLVPREPVIASSTILNLDLSRSLPEAAPEDALTRLLFEETVSLRDVLDALQRAGDDSRIKGVFARLGTDEMGTATVQELREAIAAFRAKGKFAIAFADTFGEFSPGNRSYYLATAFDEIWLQPLGAVGLTGLRVESPFFRGTLDKLGIVPRLDHRAEYKSAMNTFTDKEMGAPQREETEAIIKSIFGQMRRDVAASRRIGESDFNAIVDGGPYQGKEAEKLRPVDHPGYPDEAMPRPAAPAGGPHRVDRRRRRQDDRHGTVEHAGCLLGHRPGRRQCRHVQHARGLHAGGRAAFRELPRLRLCRLQGSRRRRPASRHGERRARRARPRMDRRGGQIARPGRRARRLRRRSSPRQDRRTSRSRGEDHAADLSARARHARANHQPFLRS